MDGGTPVLDDLINTKKIGAAPTTRAAGGLTSRQELAQRHLLMHFTDASMYDAVAPKIMVEGQGSWLADDTGAWYLDAMAGLFCVQVGYSYGAEIGEAVKSQMTALPYATNWAQANEPSVQLAAKLAELAPEGLDRTFFTSGGGEGNESAIKLVRQYHEARGQATRTKFIARRLAYHGTTYGALSINGIPAFRAPFEPLMHGVRHVSNTKRYGQRRPGRPDLDDAALSSTLLDEMERLILQEGPETVAAIVVEPLQNSGGSLVPPAGYCEGLRVLCDRYGLLLVADEVITGFGRLGEWFGSTRYGLQPDLLVFAKGITSGYAPLGGVVASNDVVETVLNGPRRSFVHGITYGGHPVACTAGLANIAIMEREGVLDHVRGTHDQLRGSLEKLTGHPLVGDVRGDGFRYTIELVTDKDSATWSAATSAIDFVNSHLAPRLLEAGLLCRTGLDAGATPAIQVSPPLVLETDEMAWLAERLGDVLDDAADALGSF
jgi:adenosylmethionine-8-amino-7-oxononanoate aminotransferase